MQARNGRVVKLISESPVAEQMAGFIAYLKESGFSASCIRDAQRLTSKLKSLAIEKGAASCSEEIGHEYVSSKNGVSKIAMQHIAPPIDRLNDCIAGKPHEKRIAGNALECPGIFSETHAMFVKYLQNKGLKEKPVDRYSFTCIRMLWSFEKSGMADLPQMQPDDIDAALSLSNDKMAFGCACRHFFSFLSKDGIVSKDLSRIVPSCKRSQRNPSTYSPKELEALRSCIGRSTP
jgi:hypothetical protein